MRRRLALVSLSTSLVIAACGDAHWSTLRWPSDRPGAPRQPSFDDAALGLAARAEAIAYEPEGVIVSLAVDNRGDASLAIERAAIVLAWDTLEYAVEPPGEHDEPAWIELEPGAGVELRLRYHLGRPLTGPGARLIVRSLTRDGAAIVELPTIELPAMPAS